MEISPKIENLPERHVAFVSYTGDYRANPQVFGDLFNKLFSWAGPKGLLTPDTLILSAYQDDPETTPPEELVVDVCMAAPEDVEVIGEVQKKVLPGGQYAIASVELESSQEYGPAWEAMVNWIKKNNYQMDVLRPWYEIYKNKPEEHPQGHHILDLCAAVKKS